MRVVLRLRFAMLEHCFELFFKRSRRNSKREKSRPVLRGRGVDLHELDLIAGEGWLRQDFGETGNGIPESKGIRISTGRNPALRAMVRNSSSYE